MELWQEIGSINFQGNIIPPVWSKQIKFDNGKTDLVSIVLLSEIVYWYRPTEVRSEDGKIVGYKKKYKYDLLQKSYDSLSDQWGITKRQAQDSLKRLEDKGFISREFRTVKMGSVICNNVLYIKPNPKAIASITNPSDMNSLEEDTLEDTSVTPYHVSTGEPPHKRDTYHVSTGEGITSERDTNTEITTEITTKNNYIYTDLYSKHNKNLSNGLRRTHRKDEYIGKSQEKEQIGFKTKEKTHPPSPPSRGKRLDGGSVGSKRVSRRLVPEDFRPDDAAYQFAKDNGIEITDLQVRHFIAHSRGKGIKYADVGEAFIGWMCQSIAMGKAQVIQTKPKSQVYL